MNEYATLPWFKTPPRLNTADYLAFVAELLAHADPAKAARQKDLEKRITTPFSLMERQKAEQPLEPLNPETKSLATRH
jgi:hypothetical protein